MRDEVGMRIKVPMHRHLLSYHSSMAGQTKEAPRIDTHLPVRHYVDQFHRADPTESAKRLFTVGVYNTQD